MTTSGSLTTLSSSLGVEEDALTVGPVMVAGPSAAASPTVEVAATPTVEVVSASGTVLAIGVPSLLVAPVADTWGSQPSGAPGTPLTSGVLGAPDLSGGGAPPWFEALEQQKHIAIT
jgi:hypothetical protein